MSGELLVDAFGHHVWATIVLIDECSKLTPQQLATNVPGTYGSIIDTMRHLVGGDVSYFATIAGDEARRISEEDEAKLELDAMRDLMVRSASDWDELLGGDLDPGREIVRHREDGIDSYAPLSGRLAQVIHHGTDHRSQICTALTSLGIEPPEIDVWAYLAKDGRVREVAQTS
jgi:uncharacterized damage-inducible protein DinB